MRRLVRRLLRGKVARRPATTREVRRELERGLGRPSPADVRSEIGRYLMRRNLFDTESDETVVAALPTATQRRRGWAWALAGVLVATAAAATFVVASQPDLVSALGTATERVTAEQPAD